MERLPEAEFEIMKVAWENPEPITTAVVMETLGKERDWKPTTIITLLGRLKKRGFLSREKLGKEYHYSSTIDKNEYLAFETELFLKSYHSNSLASLSSALSKNIGSMNREDGYKELKELLKKLGGE